MAIAGKHNQFFQKLRKKRERSNLVDLKTKADIIAGMRFDKQQALAEDPSRFKSASCGRRAGKSLGILTIAIEECCKKRFASWVIVGLTRPSIKRIYWRVLKKLDEDLELGLKYNETDLTATFSNESQIIFSGADNSSEVEKLRGNAFDGIVIDECKSFNFLVFAELVEDVLEPCLADRKGTLILIGTPGTVLQGVFYSSTCIPGLDVNDEIVSNRMYGEEVKKRFIWSHHHWTAEHNTAAPHIWKDHLDRKYIKGWADDNPTWRREYLAEWVVDTTNKVYRYHPEKHSFNHEHDGWCGLPENHNWFIVEGLDFGFDDPFAIVLWAYSDTHPGIYNIYSFKQAGINITQMARFIKEVEKEFGEPEIRIGDRGGGGKTIFAELSEQHDLYLEPADKKEKPDHIDIFNDGLDAGQIKIERDSVLAEEMFLHKWTVKNGRRTESDITKNDACDAAIYSYMYCERNRYKKPSKKSPKDSQQYWEEREKAEEAALIQREKQKNQEHMDEDWW